MIPPGSRIEADLVLEVRDARGRTSTGRVTSDTTTVHVDVDDPVALFAALPARLERGLLDAAGELLDPAPVVEVTSRGQLLAVLDPTGTSLVGGLLGGDRRLAVTPRGALVVLRGRTSARGVAAAAAVVAVVAVLARLTRRG